MSSDLSPEGPRRDDRGSTGANRRSPAMQKLRRDRRAQLVIVFALGCGGVVGAVARYAISLAIPTASGAFPWSTFIINISGSALLGFLLVLLLEQFPRGRLVRPFVGSGLIGAYTTFSTFEVDALLLFRDHRPFVGVTYLVASLAGGLIAVWVGMYGARFVIRAEQWLQGEVS